MSNGSTSIRILIYVLLGVSAGIVSLCLLRLHAPGRYSIVRIGWEEESGQVDYDVYLTWRNFAGREPWLAWEHAREDNQHRPIMHIPPCVMRGLRAFVCSRWDLTNHL